MSHYQSTDKDEEEQHAKYPGLFLTKEELENAQVSIVNKDSVDRAAKEVPEEPVYQTTQKLKISDFHRTENVVARFVAGNFFTTKMTSTLEKRVYKKIMTLQNFVKRLSESRFFKLKRLIDFDPNDYIAVTIYNQGVTEYRKLAYPGSEDPKTARKVEWLDKIHSWYLKGYDRCVPMTPKGYKSIWPFSIFKDLYNCNIINPRRSMVHIITRIFSLFYCQEYDYFSFSVRRSFITKDKVWNKSKQVYDRKKDLRLVRTLKQATRLCKRYNKKRKYEESLKACIARMKVQSEKYGRKCDVSEFLLISNYTSSLKYSLKVHSSLIGMIVLLAKKPYATRKKALKRLLCFLIHVNSGAPETTCKIVSRNRKRPSE